MGAVWMCARRALRSRIRGTLALALLVAIAGGAVIAATAGARRTEDAYGRMVRTTRAADVLVVGQGFGMIDAEEVARLPGVRAVAQVAGFGMANRPTPLGLPTRFDADFAGAAADGRWLYEMDGALMLEGRLPRQDRVYEVAVNEEFAQRSGLGVGDVYRALVMDFEAIDHGGLFDAGAQPTRADLLAAFTSVDLRITGVGRSPTDLVVNENLGTSSVVLTPAFARRFGDKIGYEFVAVRLDDPSRLGAFQRAVRRALPTEGIDLESAVDSAVLFRQATAPYVDALRLFAVIAAVTALFVVGQALVRMVRSDAHDGLMLAAIGAVRPQRAALAATRSVFAVCCGAALAGAIAYATSPFFPIGPARAAESEPGLRLDALAVVVGVAVVALVLSGVTAFAAWLITRSQGSAGSPTRSSAVADWVGRVGLPAPAVTGVRFALQRGRAPGAPTLATASIGLVAAIATVAATLVFAASLDHLVSTPSAYGWGWDVLLDTYDDGVSETMTAEVLDDRDVEALSIGSRLTLELDGDAVTAYAFDYARGDVTPAITAGRAPRGAREVALGAFRLRELGRDVGDTIEARTPTGEPVRLRVVGRAVFPSLTLNRTAGLNDGAMITTAALRDLDPAIRPSFYLARTAPGVSVRELKDRYHPLNLDVLGPQRPGEITSFASVRSTPAALAGLLALLGVGVLAHVLVTSVRARRAELALLKAIGFTRRQVAAAVAWQASTLAIVPLVIGVPLGLALGAWSWRRLADDLGIADVRIVPQLAILVFVIATLVVANVVAAFPARAAARTRPSVVLRSE